MTRSSSPQGPSKLYSCLVNPGKSTEDPDDVRATTLPPKGKLYEMLRAVYFKADQECKIPIRFVVGTDGTQSNVMRDDILSLLRRPGLPKAKKIARRLRDVTTNKSGLGLLFIMQGRLGRRHKLVVSRFPADEGILAEPTSESLELEFIERIFMKSAKSYKAAAYLGSSFEGDFWDGHAVDRQINEKQDNIADYWIREFLLSDFKTTSKAGTKRVAIALRAAVENAPTDGTKAELVSAAKLSVGLNGKSITADKLIERFGLSAEARELIVDQLPNTQLLDDTFIFDADEFIENAKFRSVELDNGAILTALSTKFDEIFESEILNAKEGDYRFSTTGRVVNQRLRKRAL